jgi:hypothetical protein
MFLGSKVRRVRNNISQPYRPPRPVTGIALLSFAFTLAKYYRI